MIAGGSRVNLGAVRIGHSLDRLGMAVNLKLPSLVDGLRRHAQQALLPPRCLICAQRSDTARDLCAACRADFHANDRCCARCALPLAVPAALCGECLKREPPFDAAFVPYVYGHPLDHLLTQLKFGHSLAAGRVVAELWLDALRPALANGVVAGLPAVVIPVPLHAQRLRERGYNQALELARPLAKAFSIPLLHDGLRRIRDIAPQSGLGALARRRNPRGAFAVGNDAFPERIALIDDVMTTGATLHECARVLRAAGVRRVDAWVAARVPPR